MKQWRGLAAVPVAAVAFALCLAPMPGLAQSSASDSQSAKDRERARQAAEQRAREEREWREIQRRQERMREADEQRAEERRKQNEQWRREMDERNQRNRAEQPSRSGAPRAPAPSAPPPAASAPRTATTAGAQLGCSAHPVCMGTGGRSNLCMGVQSTYSGSSKAGLAEITRRCREANTPDPCAQGARPAAPSYKIDTAPALSCAEQCTKVARCEPAASR